MRAAIYCRVSSDKQEREGTSLDTQLEACQKYCIEKGYELTHTFSEAESGLTLERPQLEQLRELVRNEQIDCIACYCIDRLSRDPTHGVLLTQEFEKYEVKLQTVTEDTETSELGRLITYIRGFTAKLEAEKIKERTLRGRKARLSRGLLSYGRACKLYGYDYIPGKEIGEGKRYQHKQEAKVVRNIFEWYVNEGLSIHGICYRLIAQGVKSPLNNDNWCSGTIHSILKNKAYIGITEGKHGEVKEATPAIISPELFNSAQDRLKINRELSRRNLKRDYLLRGHIYCSVCGRRYSGATKRYKDKEYTWYRCSSLHNVKQLHCGNQYWKAGDLDSLVWKEVEAVLANPELVAVGIQELEKESGRVKTYHKELEQVLDRLRHYEREKDRVWTAFRIVGDEAKFKAEIKAVMDEIERLEQRQVDIKQRIEAIQNTTATVEGIKEACQVVSQNVNNLTPEGKRLALEALNIKVWINYDQITLEGDIPIASTPVNRNGERMPSIIACQPIQLGQITPLICGRPYLGQSGGIIRGSNCQHD